MNKTAVLIKTAPGRRSLIWCLAGVEAHFRGRPYRLYISDEEPLDSWKHSLYERLEMEGHCIEVLPGRVGVGVARNRLLGEMQDEIQVLRLDDDFELGGEFCLSALEEVLWRSNEIGFVSDMERQIGAGKGVRSGTLRPGGGQLVIEKMTLIKKFHAPFPRWNKCGNLDYKFAEFTRNLLLVKRLVFSSVTWDEELLFQGEHLDFMLSLKDKGFAGAYTRSSIHLHRDDLANYRESVSGGHGDAEGLKLKARVLEKKWSVEKEKSAYGVSWYVYEGARRIVSK